ncbi:MAG: S8 family serine peptidase, partial [Deltaproteobacteria bacterium]|nr:S8 family serine peptidase [Deltaproteobacteria bacterium]
MSSKQLPIAILATVLGIAACGENADKSSATTQALTFDTSDPAIAAVTAAKKAKVYLVRLSDTPAIAYDGSIAGLAATKALPGTRFDRDSKAVRTYVAYLTKKQDKLLKASGGKTVYKYKYSFNGFSALLTPAQAAVVKTTAGVLSVEADVAHRVTTDTSPTFLGLNTTGGAWEQLGGADVAGEDVIIGVIDTGIWPEHPSFSDQIDLQDRPGASGKDTLAYGPAPAHWKGTCQSGEQWSQDDCNNKLIGARYYLTGFGHQGAYVGEYLSARDTDGHGTHTASTAGGNANVPAEIMGSNLGLVSGVAPRARIAIYKACWKQRCSSGEPHCYQDVCYSSDLTAAIDDAASDGVDVINYSIGSDAQVLLEATSVAFLFAADAGVFVATSAGNSGPGAYTVGTPAVAPWVMSVGANTHNRTYQATATLGNGSSYTGASLTGGTASLTLIDAADAGSELCYPGALNPAAVAGKIVLCKRGDIARVDKSRAVMIAGGAGMILYNANNTDTEVTDNHFVPSVHINFNKGTAIKAYITAAGEAATATLSGGLQTTTQGNVMASFSSRGPNGAAIDLIKPDVTAPGVNILAGNTPESAFGAPGQLFQAISGTSMSSPHVAGAAALIKQAHRGWSPAAIKSALMTTARQNVVKEDGITAADPFDMGAGHIVPTTSLDPGLVYHSDILNHFAFLCGLGAVQQGTCDLLASWGYSFESADLNLPSFGLGSLAGQRTVRRAVTNVGNTTATYNASASVPGVGVSINPPTLTLAPGEQGFFTVTFTVTPSAA